jgi:hypothetical protein
VVDDKKDVREKLDLSKAVWQSSAEDDDPSGEHVEVAFLEGYILMRNSAHPEGPVLYFTPSEWDAFIAGAKDGEFDEP